MVKELNLTAVPILLILEDRILNEDPNSIYFRTIVAGAMPDLGMVVEGKSPKTIIRRVEAKTEWMMAYGTRLAMAAQR